MVRLARLDDADECAAIDDFVARNAEGTPFHRPVWIKAVAASTGNPAAGIVALREGVIVGWLPLNAIHSPIFGRLLASSGFAVGGGVLVAPGECATPLFAAAEEMAVRHACASAELRGGPLPDGREGWTIKTQSHCGFIRPLADSDEAELNAIPRKQRAEVRKSLANPLEVSVGVSERDRAAHYAVYAASVRNLGTPVFPRALFDAMLDGFGDDADILTVWHEGVPVSSVLSIYHGGAVMPYWGGGIWDARRLRANDRMYYALMLHARARGCTHFDFGRSKTHSGPYDFKRNWGFEPAPLSYGVYTAPGAPKRDADPTSSGNSRLVEIWKKLPLPVATMIGPWIARGLG
ncbi:FemAB family PEP-CTERM system-associated protein [Novosphingobium sp. FSY-8]|uniref:FemAB family PEP-CTERM system-associated protein n=2 Tax=Novosphingobium ovatum TaxID=1908523 RepID=A0ABW9XC58_9SPHN|nr:FemAB family PEP-CTERM system-associated protein [Novosphingobium ovatum]